jgi:hypothetical protein
MAITAKRLSGPAQLSNTFVAQYTVPQSTTTIIKQIILTNITATAKTATVRLKPLNVVEANTHDILSNITLAANETVTFACSLVLRNDGGAASNTTSDVLVAFANANTSVNLTVVGIEEA